MSDTINGRPAGDVLSQVVRITLGGKEYVLPVRSIRANREWRTELDARTRVFLAELGQEDGGRAIEVLAGQPDLLIDLLLSYDASGVLPSKAEIESMEPDVSLELLVACREVWRAAVPLAAIVLAELDRAMSSARTSSSPTPTAGITAGSRMS